MVVLSRSMSSPEFTACHPTAKVSAWSPLSSVILERSEESRFLPTRRPSGAAAPDSHLAQVRVPRFARLVPRLARSVAGEAAPTGAGDGADFTGGVTDTRRPAALRPVGEGSALHRGAGPPCPIIRPEYATNLLSN